MKISSNIYPEDTSGSLRKRVQALEKLLHEAPLPHFYAMTQYYPDWYTKVQGVLKGKGE